MDSDDLIISIHDTSISLKKLRKYLEELYPSLGLNEINFVFAVNKVICNEDINVKSSDEIAIIPPISGG
jgi:molybdopterin converting factor small subunit